MNEKSDFHEHLEGWFAGRLPAEWFVGPIDVSFDRDEILVVGTLAEPELPKDAGPETRTAAAEAKISGFREDTRAQRMRIADEAERDRPDRAVLTAPVKPSSPDAETQVWVRGSGSVVVRACPRRSWSSC